MELDASLNAGQHDPSLPHRKHVQERHMDVVYLVVVYRNCQECAFSSFKLNPFATMVPVSFTEVYWKVKADLRKQLNDMESERRNSEGEGIEVAS